MDSDILNSEMYEGVEKPPEGLSKEELKEWMKKHRDYDELTLDEYMMMPTRNEYHDLICSVPRDHREGDKYRIGDDPEVGDLVVYMEFVHVETKLRKTDLARSMDPINLLGEVPLTTVNMKLKLCWIVSKYDQ
jgi:hypothetical protein